MLTRTGLEKGFSAGFSLLFYFLLFCLFIAGNPGNSFASTDERRIALVIGNSDYRFSPAAQSGQ